MKKIYISGGIKNVPDYAEKFQSVENQLICAGWAVVNPVKIGNAISFPENSTDEEKYKLYMKEDLKALLDCDCIFMMSGWNTSKGACFELDTADMCGIETRYETTV